MWLQTMRVMCYLEMEPLWKKKLLKSHATKGEEGGGKKLLWPNALKIFNHLGLWNWAGSSLQGFPHHFGLSSTQQ